MEPLRAPVRVPPWALIALIAILGTAVAPAWGAPTIAEKRAEVARITAELQAIDHRVEDAAEEHNGARYRLSQARGRVTENRRAITRTTRDLRERREVLADRIRGIYTTQEPSLAQVLVTSGSLSAALDQVQLLERIGENDADLVGGLRQNRERLAGLRLRLVADRAAAGKEVAAAERQVKIVEGLLASRREVLDGAQGDLAQLLAAQEAQKRREAAAAAELARQRQAAAAAAPASSPSTNPPAATPTPATPAAPAAEPTPAPPASAPLPSGSGNAAAASVAMRYLGVPYRWGGASPSGFDCSGLASYAYAQIGKSVPHYTVAIWNAFPKVPSGQLQVGDLVFYRGLGHMGIYIGGGQYVHAPQTGDVVKVSGLNDRSDYVGAVRP